MIDLEKHGAYLNAMGFKYIPESKNWVCRFGNDFIFVGRCITKNEEILTWDELVKYLEEE